MPMSPEAEAEITAMVEESKGGDFLARNVQDIFVVLKRHGLLSTMRIPPLHVGVHPSKRDGACLVTQDVHELLDSICQVGFVPSRVQAVGVEVCDPKEREFNAQLVHSSGEALGCMDASILKVLSLSASHTNWALRLIVSRAPHNTGVVSVEGRISMELVQQRDPVLAEHAQVGLHWQIVSAEVAKRFPDLLLMIQASYNATLQKTESELQLLRRVCTLLARHGAGSTPDYATVKKQALASRPPCGDSLPGIFKFALRQLCCRHEVFLFYL